jgi:hypothetical protein
MLSQVSARAGAATTSDRSASAAQVEAADDFTGFLQRGESGDPVVYRLRGDS